MRSSLLPALFLTLSLSSCGNGEIGASDSNTGQTPAVTTTPSPIYANQGRNTEALDILTFGDAASESDHSLSSVSSETVTGGLGQSARRLLPLDPQGLYGGHLTFDMTVDPKKRNYVSVKFWGDDGGNADIGRIYLYVIQDGEEYQVGYRHEGDYMPLSVAGWGQDLPGRFFYSTTLLPLKMTLGKSSIKLRLVSTGRLYGLGQGGPPDGNYQFAMNRPSKTIYRAYTHTDAYLNVSDEVQATLPSSTAKPGPGDEILQQDGAFRARINSVISNKMSSQAENLNQGDTAYLAKAYHVPETSAYHSADLVTKVVEAIDAYATRYYANPNASGWGGRYGYIGKTIHFLGDALEPHFDTVVDYGDGGELTRRQAWGDMLFASREYGRLTRSQRSLTNQAMIANDAIYSANKGLRHLNDSRAFSEEKAQRYIKEACGLLPWLGSDLPDGGHYQEFGSNYYLVTKKGQTRELGYVADSYGEMTFHVAEWYDMSGNEAFRNQAIKMLKARAAFKRPGVEINSDSGEVYRLMQAVSLLSWRGAPESDGELASSMSYADRSQWALGIRVAAATGDPTLIGYARHMLEDKRFFTSLMSAKRNAETFQALDVFKDYQVIQQADDNGERLPMADSQSNFAWADEQNAIVALKHGDERLWVSAYWQAKYGINNIARFHYSTSNYDQYGVLETVTQFKANDWMLRPSYYIDKPEGNQWAPPNQPKQAYGNERLAVGIKPDDARSSGPFRGKADFYSFRFGHFLVGINAHPSDSYLLYAPNDIGSAENLFTGTPHTQSVEVAPESTVALYLDAEADAKPQPGSSQWLEVIADGTEANIEWSAASGAAHYSVLRSQYPNSEFVEVGSNITETQFKDSSLPTSNITYYYRIVAYSENGGPGYPSVAVSTLYTSLPDGWSDSNIGSDASGSTLYDPLNNEMIVSGSGWDIGSTADSFHFTHKPIQGDASLVVKINDWHGGKGSNKMGLMIRESLHPGSKAAIVMLSQAEKYVRFASRGGNNQGMSYQNFPDISIWAPRWLKIERSGNVITGYASTDGENWQQTGQATINMYSDIYIGMAVSPRSAGKPVTTHFEVL